MKSGLSLVALTLLLAGCEVPGFGPDPRIALREADSRAIGGACRHAMRGIEDCYGLNEKALKTAVFQGWKEMDQYMRENKIEGIPPKEARAQDSDEVIVEDKNPKAAAARDKASGDAKPRPGVALASQKPPEKAASASAK